MMEPSQEQIARVMAIPGTVTYSQQSGILSLSGTVTVQE